MHMDRDEGSALVGIGNLKMMAVDAVDLGVSVISDLASALADIPRRIGD